MKRALPYALATLVAGAAYAGWPSFEKLREPTRPRLSKQNHEFSEREITYIREHKPQTLYKVIEGVARRISEKRETITADNLLDGDPSNLELDSILFTWGGDTGPGIHYTVLYDPVEMDNFQEIESVSGYGVPERCRKEIREMRAQLRSRFARR